MCGTLVWRDFIGVVDGWANYWVGLDEMGLDWLNCNVDGFVRSTTSDSSVHRHGDIERQCQPVIPCPVLSVSLLPPLRPSDSGTYNIHSSIRALILMKSSDPCRSSSMPSTYPHRDRGRPPRNLPPASSPSRGQFPPYPSLVSVAPSPPSRCPCRRRRVIRSSPPSLRHRNLTRTGAKQQQQQIV